jgi:hypothetical protein
MDSSIKTKAIARKKSKKQEESEYDMVKSTNQQFNKLIRKRYKTRICFIIIAICHSLYLLMNFIIMSQARLASFALQGLSELNVACKFSFFLFPPTTAYNLLSQLCIWTLCYAIFKHARKLRSTVTHDFDRHADYDIDLMSSDDDDEESSSGNDDEPEKVPYASKLAVSSELLKVGI